MPEDLNKRARDVFLELSTLDPAGTGAELDRLVGDDGALRDAVVRLLDARDQADRVGLMASPTASVIPEGLDEAPGTRIGPYKILQRIGEGGFGAVYLADQTEPVRRRVALKIIKLGMDTRQVIARFEAERQALALMDHPHIARVIDAGTTDSGRPYFAMEYVVGDAITRFADAYKLDLSARLALFSQVCSAVQHAHTKGVIHRDLKPGNVLVSMVDGEPFARVIDFGIAKATATPLTDKTLFTEHRQLIGTPEYMSPEQAEGSPDIDTRTDVYALGVLLYELLTDTTPFDPDRLRSAGYGEIQRILREEDPPMPSVRVTRNVASLAKTAEARRVDVPRLQASIRGELDWIVMKALEKERGRRYESPAQLADDVQRHLSGSSVRAAPPSRVYRLRKFVRRNRAGVVGGSAVASVFLIGLLGTSWNWMRAEAATAELRDQVELADRRATETEAVLSAFDEMLRSVRSDSGASVTVRSMLDSHATQLVDLESASPRAAARVRQTLSLAYLGLDAYEDAYNEAVAATELLGRLDPRPEDAEQVRVEIFASRLQAIAVLGRWGTDSAERRLHTEGQLQRERALAECGELLAVVEADPGAANLRPHVLYRFARLTPSTELQLKIGRYREAAEAARSSDPADVPYVVALAHPEQDVELRAMGRIAQSLTRAALWDEAETEYLGQLSRVAERFGILSESFAERARYTAWFYNQVDRPALALGYARLAVLIGREASGTETEHLAKTYALAGRAARAAGRDEDAAWLVAHRVRLNAYLLGASNLYSQNGARDLVMYASYAGLSDVFSESVTAFVDPIGEEPLEALDAVFAEHPSRLDVLALMRAEREVDDASTRQLDAWESRVADALRGDGDRS